MSLESFVYCPAPGPHQVDNWSSDTHNQQVCAQLLTRNLFNFKFVLNLHSFLGWHQSTFDLEHPYIRLGMASNNLRSLEVLGSLHLHNIPKKNEPCVLRVLFGTLLTSGRQLIVRHAQPAGMCTCCKVFERQPWPLRSHSHLHRKSWYVCVVVKSIDLGLCHVLGRSPRTSIVPSLVEVMEFYCLGISFLTCFVRCEDWKNCTMPRQGDRRRIANRGANHTASMPDKSTLAIVRGCRLCTFRAFRCISRCYPYREDVYFKNIVAHRLERDQHTNNTKYSKNKEIESECNLRIRREGLLCKSISAKCRLS